MVTTVEIMTFLKAVMNTTTMKTTLLKKMKQKANSQAKKRALQRKRVMRMSLTSMT